MERRRDVGENDYSEFVFDNEGMEEERVEPNAPDDAEEAEELPLKIAEESKLDDDDGNLKYTAAINYEYEKHNGESEMTSFKEPQPEVNGDAETIMVDDKSVNTEDGYLT